jgi:hypothetical protein
MIVKRKQENGFGKNRLKCKKFEKSLERQENGWRCDKEN